MRRRVRLLLLLSSLAPAVAAAQQPPAQQPPARAAGATGDSATATPPRRGPRPYAQVIPARAHTERGALTIHKVDDRYFFEVPDSLLDRDYLLVSRIAGVPAGTGGFMSAGSVITERMVRFERFNDRVLIRSATADAYSEDSLPIALSVRQNNYGPILSSWTIAAYTRDSSSYVVDVTDFFGGDTPALSGLSAAQRRTYGVRRYDTARSYVSSVRSFPINIEVRHVQTFDASDPPGDRSSGTVTLEMRQSLVLLPKKPMPPRNFDARVGYFTVDRVNYGLDQQKAADETFITRWRLEPKDPAAYARGELVEPIKPITYYIDPGTPTKWRRYVKEGVESWQAVFEKAGFKKAIVALEPPTKAQDPDWDPDDARVSMVRWAASLVRNATGPHTGDPRTGEILNSEITWYHNHMRSYRNRLLVETGAANPPTRTLEIPEALMGETMRQVIAHEIGHALGLQHNMVASNSIPVDSLRSPTFTSKYGVSLTIMDYARQNYVAQPGDGLKPKDFVRRLGPFDDFAINWGYRVLPVHNVDEEKATLNQWITSQSGFFAYRYVPQQLGSLDPRAQTEDVGDDAMKASGYAVKNMKVMVPSLVQWTTKAGDGYGDLAELYDEALQMWSLYMGHVTTWIGGVNVDNKTADQAGAVFRIVPKARQKSALAFLNDNVFTTPAWLEPKEISSRIGPSGLATRQSNVLTSLMSTARLGRMADEEKFDATNAYPMEEYLGDLRRDVFSGAADANRRALQRTYVMRLGAIVNPPVVVAGPAFGPPGGEAARPAAPFLTPINVERSDLPAVARQQLREIQRDARVSSLSAKTMIERAHWADLADRAKEILDPRK